MIDLFIGTFMALFSVVNPLGAMPVFVTLTQESSPGYRKAMAIRATIFMACILILFFLFGTYIIQFFGISLESMRIAGGLIIIKAGYSLLNSNYEKEKGLGKKVRKDAMKRTDISFSPLAMPMLSGPGSIALMIGIGGTLTDISGYFIVISATVAVALISFVILIVSPKLVEKLGQSGIVALSKMMGFIVLCIGIQYIVNGAAPLLGKIFIQN